MTISAAKKPLSFWQLESVVIQEGEESCTTNLCQKCHNDSLKAKGEKTLTNWQWRQFVGQTAHCGRLWKMMGKKQYVRGMCECFCREMDRVRRFREQAEEEKQAGIQGQWQLESPAKGYSEQVKSCNDTDYTQRMMKQCFIALKSGNWEEHKTNFRAEVNATEWASDTIIEAFEQVALDEARKLSIVQEITIRSTDNLRRITAPAGGHGGITMSYLCSHCNSFPLEDYIWWVSVRKHTNWWCAICGENYDWEQPNRLLFVQTGESINQAKVFKAHAVPQGLLRKSDKCDEVVGEPTRRWRRPHTEHCDKPQCEEQEGPSARAERIHKD